MAFISTADPGAGIFDELKAYAAFDEPVEVYAVNKSGEAVSTIEKMRLKIEGESITGIPVFATVLDTATIVGAHLRIPGAEAFCFVPLDRESIAYRGQQISLHNFEIFVKGV